MKKYSKEWANAQSREQKFTLSDREPDEDDITEKQLKYIKRLLKDADDKELRALGKWQASEFIEQILEAREDFTEDMIEEANRPRGISMKAVLIFAVIIALLIAIFSD